jgi:hypothetical protein
MTISDLPLNVTLATQGVSNESLAVSLRGRIRDLSPPIDYCVKRDNLLEKLDENNEAPPILPIDENFYSS